MGNPDPVDLICTETQRLPFKSSGLSRSTWKDSFRSWPSSVPGWCEWYERVRSSKIGEWENLGIAHCLRFSLVDIGKNESLLSAASYLWSDALNAFLFGHGPMTPTLLDVKAFTDLDITSTASPGSLQLATTHRLDTRSMGWKKYITQFHRTGTVTPREHTAFLMMWLDHFLFCGVSVSPTTSFQHIAEILVKGIKIPLGKYLLGALYHTLHQASVKLRSFSPVGNLGGPWWLLQMWLHLHLNSAMDRPLLLSRRFPDGTTEDRVCESIGEALVVIPGSAPSDDLMAATFRILYKGIAHNRLSWFPYNKPEYLGFFTVPSSFRANEPLKDAESAAILLAYIRPCYLPTGLYRPRIQNSYEFYYPNVAARQLGFGQLPIGLFYADKAKARCTVSTPLEYNWLSGLNENLPMGDFDDIILVSSSTKLFAMWWAEWSRHLFCNNTASHFTHLELQEPSAEVKSFLLCRFFLIDLVFPINFFLLCVSLIPKIPHRRRAAV